MSNAVYQCQINSNSNNNSNNDSDKFVLEPPVRIISWHYRKEIRTHIVSINFMVTPCINNIHHFNNQLMHTTLKNLELLKHFKISKTASTCFGLQGNHHQGATIST